MDPTQIDHHASYHSPLHLLRMKILPKTSAGEMVGRLVVLDEPALTTRSSDIQAWVNVRSRCGTLARL